LSGTTTITSAGHTALLTYNGQNSCTSDGMVDWSLDGTAQGKMEVPSCAAVPGASLWSLSLVGMVGLLRRRARS
jgi:uncharacterized protein (TIGR03382 family)